MGKSKISMNFVVYTMHFTFISTRTTNVAGDDLNKAKNVANSYCLFLPFVMDFLCFFHLGTLAIHIHNGTSKERLWSHPGLYYSSMDLQPKVKACLPTQAFKKLAKVISSGSMLERSIKIKSSSVSSSFPFCFNDCIPRDSVS